MHQGYHQFSIRLFIINTLRSFDFQKKLATKAINGDGFFVCIPTYAVVRFTALKG